MKYLVDYQVTKPGQGISNGSIDIEIDSDVESVIIEKAKEMVMKQEGTSEVKIGLISPEC